MHCTNSHITPTIYELQHTISCSAFRRINIPSLPQALVYHPSTITITTTAPAAVVRACRHHKEHQPNSRHYDDDTDL